MRIVVLTNSFRASTWSSSQHHRYALRILSPPRLFGTGAAGPRLCVFRARRASRTSAKDLSKRQTKAIAEVREEGKLETVDERLDGAS